MELIPFKNPRERAKADPPGVEAVVLSKIEELSFDTPFELLKLIAWVHTLKDKDARDRCKDLIRAKFVTPYAMSHDQYEYGRALQLSDALGAPEDALAALREFTLRKFAHQAGSAGAMGEWDAQSLARQLEAVVQRRRMGDGMRNPKEQDKPLRSKSESGERLTVSASDLESSDTLDEEDGLGGRVDSHVRAIYDAVVNSDRSAV